MLSGQWLSTRCVYALYILYILYTACYKRLCYAVSKCDFCTLISIKCHVCTKCTITTIYCFYFCFLSWYHTATWFIFSMLKRGCGIKLFLCYDISRPVFFAGILFLMLQKNKAQILPVFFLSWLDSAEKSFSRDTKSGIWACDFFHFYGWFVLIKYVLLSLWLWLF